MHKLNYLPILNLLFLACADVPAGGKGQPPPPPMEEVCSSSLLVGDQGEVVKTRLYPVFLVSGDLNCDGIDDLIAGECESGFPLLSPVEAAIVVRFGTSDDMLRAPVEIQLPADRLPSSAEVTDINGDGAPDLLLRTALYGGPERPSVGSSLLVLDGECTMDLRLAREMIVEGDGGRFASGDLDADGDLDILWESCDINSLCRLRVLVGDGSGAFSPSLGFQVSSDSWLSWVTADFDDDNRLDIVVRDGEQMWLWRGDGTGNFRVDSISVGTGGPVLASDFNGDGLVDLLIAKDTWSFSGPLEILLNTGDGVFVPVGGLPIEGAPLNTGTVDLDLDGHVDLYVLGESWLDSTLALLRGTGDGRFEVLSDPVVVPWSTAGFGGVAVVNGGASGGIAYLGGEWIGVMPFGEEHRIAGLPSSIRTRTPPLEVGLGDVENDGYADVLLVGEYWAAVLPRVADGRVGDLLYLETAGALRSLLVEDLDGDGAVELAIVSRREEQECLLVGKIDRMMEDCETLNGHEISWMTSRDFDGDGRADLAMTGRSTEVLLQVEGQRFKGSFQIDLAGVAIGAGDFDGDRKVDLAVLAEASPASGTLHILFGDGVGGFEDLEVPGAIGGSLAVGDLDDDGLSDIVLAGNRGLVWVAGDRSKIFVARAIAVPCAGARLVRLADVNGDGVLDILVGDDSETVAVVLGAGNFAFEMPSFYPVGFEIEAMAVGNRDGDGGTPIVVSGGSRSRLLLVSCATLGGL